MKKEEKANKKNIKASVGGLFMALSEAIEFYGILSVVLTTLCLCAMMIAGIKQDDTMLSLIRTVIRFGMVAIAFGLPRRTYKWQQKFKETDPQKGKD